MRVCTFLGQAKGRGEMDTRMEADGRQAACRDALSSCPSFASPPGSELAPPVPTISQKHQHQHPHAAQRDVGQHAPSPATSPPGRRVHASRNHPAEKTPCSSTPIQSARLSQAARQQRVDPLQSACPAGCHRRACGLATRAMCRPLLLLSDASSTRAGARCLRCRQTCHRCGEYGLHERTSATSWARLNGITCHGGTDPRVHLEPLPAPWAAHHPVATFATGWSARPCGLAARAICWPWPLRRGDPERPRPHRQSPGWRIPRSNGVLCHWLGGTGGQQAFRLASVPARRTNSNQFNSELRFAIVIENDIIHPARTLQGVLYQGYFK